MNSDSTKQIIDALRPVADKLGQGATHLYAVYVRQAYIWGVGELIWSIVLLLIAAFGVFVIAKWHETFEGDTVWPTGVFAVIALLVGVGFLADGVQHLLNPEYYAIHSIICDAKGGCQ